VVSGRDPDRRRGVSARRLAGGWALSILLGLDDTGAHILQACCSRPASSILVGVFIRALARRASLLLRVAPERAFARLTNRVDAPPPPSLHNFLNQL